MSCMPDTSLAANVAPRTGIIIKNFRVFEKGENLLQNGTLHFVFKLSHHQKSY